MSKLTQKAGLVLLWLVFLFLLLQGAGFFYFDVLKMEAVGQYGYPAGFYAAHDQLDYIYTPGFQGKFTGGAYSDIDISINQHGFRDNEFTPASGHMRIAVLGDSVVFGSGVRKEERFTERLETGPWGILNNVDTLNFGVNSYTFEHYLELARLRFMKQNPAFVVLGFTLNDIAEKEQSGPAKRVNGTDTETDADWHKRLQKTLDRTYTGRFISELKARIKMARATAEEQREYHTVWMRSVDTAWRQDDKRQQLFSRIDEFDKLMKQQNTGYLFLIFPELNALLEPEVFSYPRTALLSYLEEKTIPYCDIFPAFANYDGDLSELFLNQDNVHFTPTGHALVAEQLSACLQQQLE